MINEIRNFVRDIRGISQQIIDIWKKLLGNAEQFDNFGRKLAALEGRLHHYLYLQIKFKGYKESRSRHLPKPTSIIDVQPEITLVSHVFVKKFLCYLQLL
jgi:hypothetical protein